MAKLELERYREDLEKSLQWDRPFYVERPAAFSPAAAAQEQEGRIKTLTRFCAIWIPWQYSSWVEEGISFHETVYIGDWSPIVKFYVKGPDAAKFLSYAGTNDLSKFEVGQIRHHIQTNEQGKISGEGILYRVTENEFRYTGGGGYWAKYMFQQGRWDAEAGINSPDYFLYHVQGPRSLAVLEKVTGGGLKDIRFNRWRMSKIGAAEVCILRTGVTGELGYEIHGPTEYGSDVWTAVVEAGREFGIKQIGYRSQLISHIEAGIATIGYDYIPAAFGTPGQSRVHIHSDRRGSYEETDIKEFFRSPFELDWDSRVALDTHDFVGRDALMAEKKQGGPARRLVGLVWNSDDVIDVFAAMFRNGSAPPPMEMPRLLAFEPDKVLKGGELVGCSTSRVYSPYLRKMISLCTIKKPLAEPGTEVTVIWGDVSGPQREIRATVAKLPFKEDKRRIDVTKI